MGVSTKYSRRKIRLDRGDTLGGTVPLSLRNHVQPDVGFGERRFGKRRRNGGSGALSWILTIVLALVLAAGIGLAIGAINAPEAADAGTGLLDRLGVWLAPLVERVTALFEG